MIRTFKTAAAALTLAAAFAVSGAQAFQPANLDFQGGGQVKLKVTKAQLGIISPDNCPGAGKLNAWIFTNKPGTVNIMIVEKGGKVSGPYAVTTVKGSGGVVMGTYSQNLMIHHPVDADYRVVVVGSDAHSNWVPLSACL